MPPHDFFAGAGVRQYSPPAAFEENVSALYGILSEAAQKILLMSTGRSNDSRGCVQALWYAIADARLLHVSILCPPAESRTLAERLARVGSSIKSLGYEMRVGGFAAGFSQTLIEGGFAVQQYARTAPASVLAAVSPSCINSAYLVSASTVAEQLVVQSLVGSFKVPGGNGSTF